jgi:hypothetical protein
MDGGRRHPCPQSGLRRGGSGDRREVALQGGVETRRRRCPYHVLELEAEDGVDLIGVEWRRAGMRWTPMEDCRGTEGGEDMPVDCGGGGAASLGGWRRNGAAMGEGIEEVGGALSPSHRSDRRRRPK